jgi:hypothetical protein
MTQDEVLKMARRAGYFIYDLTETHKKKTVETDEADEWAQLERFAKLVAQHERERIFGELLKIHEKESSRHNYFLHAVVTIRAKGEKK